MSNITCRYEIEWYAECVESWVPIADPCVTEDEADNVFEKKLKNFKPGVSLRIRKVIVSDEIVRAEIGEAKNGTT